MEYYHLINKQKKNPNHIMKYDWDLLFLELCFRLLLVEVLH